MDSMSGLNTSLPHSGASPNKQQHPEPLLAAFKAAALSVTQLYKLAAADQNSVADQNRLRAEGYQEAIDELLQFLDRENIGVGDGEGWRIRQWATERYDREPVVSAESDEETASKGEDAKQPAERDSSPTITRSQSMINTAATNTRAPSPVRADSVPPASSANPTGSAPSTTSIPQGAFTFRANQPYPQDSDMMLSDLRLSDRTIQDAQSNTVPGQARGTVEAHSTSYPTSMHSATRQSRTESRRAHGSRHGVRTGGLIGKGAGSKRKINLGDFFDISSLGHGKDTFGGGKRARFS